MSLTITLLAAVRASEIGPSACYGVFARSFRDSERKLEFLSAQHVKLGFQVVLRENYPVLFAQNYQNKQKELGALPRAHFHGSTTRGHSKAPVPTTVGPADKGARLPLASKRLCLRGRVKGHRGGGGEGASGVAGCSKVRPSGPDSRRAALRGRPGPGAPRGAPQARPGDSS
jgi:hypothetical protein